MSYVNTIGYSLPRLDVSLYVRYTGEGGCSSVTAIAGLGACPILAGPRQETDGPAVSGTVRGVKAGRVRRVWGGERGR